MRGSEGEREKRETGVVDEEEEEGGGGGKRGETQMEVEGKERGEPREGKRKHSGEKKGGRLYGSCV